MEKLDDILTKHYKQMKGNLVSPKGECPKEDLWWNYVRRELTEDEREHLDGHLLTCSECLEMFKVIRMIHEAQKSSLEVPASIAKRAREILERELEKPDLQLAEIKPVIMRITLLWDQILNRITQLTSGLEEMIGGTASPQFQAVRKVQANKQKGASTFPYMNTISIPEGTIVLEIDHSGKGKYVTLKVSLQSEQREISDQVSGLRLILYKSDRIAQIDRICSSVYPDIHGEAVFDRIREGSYRLELLVKDRSLGVIEISLSARPES